GSRFFQLHGQDLEPTQIRCRGCAGTWPAVTEIAIVERDRADNYFRYSCSIKPLFSISLKKLASTKSAGAKCLVLRWVSRSRTASGACSLGAGNRSNRLACSS